MSGFVGCIGADETFVAPSLLQGHGRDRADQGPWTSEDGAISLVFHGALYGVQDPESFIASRYERNGLSFLAELNGGFALALWDARARQLVLARDRVGKKPLYYTRRGSELFFSSEIKELLSAAEIAAEPDLEAIHEYLTFQYVPTPKTAFQGIFKLPPAHALVWKGGEIETKRYWSLSYAGKLSLSEKEAAHRFLELLEESVQRRMAGEASIGAFLSGGIDSSAVVATMAKLSDIPVKTFAVGFHEHEYNELNHARQVAERFGTDHHELIVEPEMVQALPQLVWHYAEPFSDSSAVATYFGAQLAASQVNVVLGGDGGDEFFAGYERYKAYALAHRLHAMPTAARRLLMWTARALPSSRNRRSFASRLKRFAEHLSTSPARNYGMWMSHFHHAEKLRLYTPEFWDAIGGAERDVLADFAALFDASDGTDAVEAAMDVDVQTYLPDDLLVKVGVACRANDLEPRSPFLDASLMEFAAALPSRYKLKGGQTKAILKRALEGTLSTDLLHRRKMGFGVPIDQWFRGELKTFAYDVLLSKKAKDRGYFNMRHVEALLDEHVRGEANHQYRLWSLLVLEIWHEQFVDGLAGSPDQAEPKASNGSGGIRGQG